MNNTQLYLSIGIPTIAVTLAWLFNEFDINSLRAEIRYVKASLRAEIKYVESSLRAEIKNVVTSLRAEMNALRREIHSGTIPLHERLAVVEAKQDAK